MNGSLLFDMSGEKPYPLLSLLFIVPMNTGLWTWVRMSPFLGLLTP
jgi:hypothetical protein